MHTWPGSLLLRKYTVHAGVDDGIEVTRMERVYTNHLTIAQHAYLSLYSLLMTNNTLDLLSVFRHNS